MEQFCDRQDHFFQRIPNSMCIDFVELQHSRLQTRNDQLCQVDQDSREQIKDYQELSTEFHRPRTLMTSVETTRDEVREHRLTHWSHRSRCSECVRGRGKDARHMKLDINQDKLPTADMEECFLTEEGGSEEQIWSTTS